MNEKSPKYLVDLNINALRVEYDDCHTTHMAYLRPSGTAVRWLGNSLHFELRGEILDLIAVLENAHLSLPSIPASTVILGRSWDPFAAGISAFSAVFALIRSLAAANPNKLILQTRSPLILPFIPLLRRRRVQVSLGFDCPDDRSSALLSPHFPRTSDRLAALSALKHAGIDVSVQLFPRLRTRYPLAKARAFAHELAKYDVPILLIDPLEPYQREPGCRTTTEAREIFENIFSLERIPFLRANVKEEAETLKVAA